MTDRTRANTALAIGVAAVCSPALVLLSPAWLIISLLYIGLAYLVRHHITRGLGAIRPRPPVQADYIAGLLLCAVGLLSLAGVVTGSLQGA